MFSVREKILTLGNGTSLASSNNCLPTSAPEEDGFMLRASIIFFILALVAMLFGAYGVAGLSMDIGRILLFVFLVLAVISFLASLISGRSDWKSP
jgi:uncharacterized membrane protein YtjA (UPF0391 family)